MNKIDLTYIDDSIELENEKRAPYPINGKTKFLGNICLYKDSVIGEANFWLYLVKLNDEALKNKQSGEETKAKTQFRVIVSAIGYFDKHKKQFVDDEVVKLYEGSNRIFGQHIVKHRMYIADNKKFVNLTSALEHSKPFETKNKAAQHAQKILRGMRDNEIKIVKDLKNKTNF